MSLSKKHFQALEDALAISGASSKTVVAIAAVCYNFNPNFDPQRFYNWIDNRRDNPRKPHSQTRGLKYYG